MGCPKDPCAQIGIYKLGLGLDKDDYMGFISTLGRIGFKGPCTPIVPIVEYTVGAHGPLGLPILDV